MPFLQRLISGGKSLSQKIASNVVFVGITQVAVAGISLLLSVILTRMFSPTLFGRYAIALAVSGGVLAVGSQWLTQGTNRFLPVTDNAEEILSIKKGVVAGIITLVTGLIIIGLVALIVVPICRTDMKDLVYPIAVMTISAMVFTVVARVLQASSKAKAYGAYILIAAVLKFLLIISFLKVLGKHVTLLLWAEALSNAILLFFVWRSAKLPPISLIFYNEERQAALKSLHTLWTYGALMTGWFIGTAILSVGDRYLIGLLRNSTEVGVYAANYNLVNGSIGLASAPVLLVLHPFLMKAWANQNASKFGLVLGRIVEAIWGIGIILVGAFFVFSYDIAYYLFPSKYWAGHIVMPIAVLGILFWNVGLYIHKPLECGQKTGTLMALSLGCAALNIVLNLIFIPIYGFMAAAATTTASYLFYCIGSYYAGRSSLNWQMPWSKCFFALAVTTFCVVISFLTRQVATNHVGRISSIVIACLVYVGLSGMRIIRIARSFAMTGREFDSH